MEKADDIQSVKARTIFPGAKSAPIVILSLLVFLIPFYCQDNYVINAFYHFGAPFYDAGMFANLLWRNDWSLTVQHVTGDYSYLGIHFSPFLMLINGLSYFVPTHMVEFYAGFMACIYASLALSMFCALMICTRAVLFRQMVVFALLAVGFSFNAFVMQGVWMPHFEYVIATGLFLFFLCYGLGRMRLAVFFFVFTLLTREDAGFHIAAVLGLLVAVRSFIERGLRLRTSEAFFLLAAFAYSILAWFITFHIRAADGVSGSTFQIIYSGAKPYYSHLTGRLLLARAGQIAIQAPCLYLTFLITFGWAAWKKNPYLTVGFAAFIPWLLLNWSAYNGNTGMLYAWYLFPLVLSLGWPCIAVLWQYNGKPPASEMRSAVLLQAILIIACLFVWDADKHRPGFAPVYWSRWGSYAPQWLDTSSGATRDMRPVIREVVAAIDGNLKLGTIMLDQNMMCLSMGSLYQHRGLNLRKLSDHAVADVALYFCPSGDREKLVPEWARPVYALHYRVPHTSICIVSNHDQSNLGALGLLATPLYPPRQLKK